jgi:4'-phosphopantetheinyl transferase EntD
MLPRIESGCELSRNSLKRFIAYCIKEKYENVSIDEHAGVADFESNLDLDMLRPHEMHELGLLNTKKEFEDYVDLWAEAAADEIVTHNELGRSLNKDTPNDFEGFTHILTFSAKERALFKSEEFKKFAMERSDDLIASMTGTAEVNFKRLVFPHYKEKGPHTHNIMSSYTLDYQKFSFFRGKADEPSEEGLIKLFNDWLYEREVQYPFLEPVEHNRRIKVEEAQAAKNDNLMVTGLQNLLVKYGDDNFYHAEFKRDFTDAGFKMFADKRVLSISLNGSKLKGIKSLDPKLTRLLELYDKFNYIEQSTDDDVSKKVREAAKYINAHVAGGNPVSFEQLNKDLHSRFSMYLAPSKSERSSKTGKFVHSQWSLQLLEYDTKISAKQVGIDVDNIKLHLHEAQLIQSKIIEIEQRRKLAQQVRTYQHKQKQQERLFSIMEGETDEEFFKRMRESGNKATLVQQTIKGNSIYNKYDRLLFTKNSRTNYSVFAGGEPSVVQHAYANGCQKMELIGGGPESVRTKLYIEAKKLGMEVIGYTPTPETQQLLKTELDKIYHLKCGANIAKIDRLIEDGALNPDAELKKINLVTNRKFQTDVDYKSKMFGVLYSKYKNLTPDAFVHYTSGLETMSVEQKKEVAEDFKAAYSLTDSVLNTFLADAGIDVDKEPQNALEAAPVPAAPPMMKAPQSYDPVAAPAPPKSYDPVQSKGSTDVQPSSPSQQQPGSSGSGSQKPVPPATKPKTRKIKRT